MEQIIRKIIIENQERQYNNIIERRSIQIPLNLSIIISIVGARKSGKTWLLYSLINKLRNSGIKKKQIVFINFEDERLTLTQKSLNLIIQSYLELYPEADLSKTWFFFDEIQNITGWEKFVRRIFDTISKKIFITGSNSKLLSSEIATKLRGRTLTFKVFPFSFNEYLFSQKVEEKGLTQASRSKLVNLSGKFIFEGGFPELINFEKGIKTKILQEYFNVMIYRDIVERYNISNPEVLKFFIKKIFASVTLPMSVNKAYNNLKLLGYKISNKYLYEYLDHCNSIFLTQNINKFHFSEIKQAKSDKKVYIVDTGLLSAIDFAISGNKGKLLENAVAMELLKQEKSIFYFKENYECDFIVNEKGNFHVLQVAWTINDNETRKRELRGLYQACKHLKTNTATIITFNEEDTFEYQSVVVNVVPFYRYFGH